MVDRLAVLVFSVLMVIAIAGLLVLLQSCAPVPSYQVTETVTWKYVGKEIYVRTFDVKRNSEVSVPCVVAVSSYGLAIDCLE